MIILITGCSHTGKTMIAQKLLETYYYPYLSLDHLKMGLIRSGNACITPTSSNQMITKIIWPIVSEIIKTAIENEQNLIVEGCYIPYDWELTFSNEYLNNIYAFRLILSEAYIRVNYEKILHHATCIEQRLPYTYPLEEMILDNTIALQTCLSTDIPHILIDHDYEQTIQTFIYKQIARIDMK